MCMPASFHVPGRRHEFCVAFAGGNRHGGQAWLNNGEASLSVDSSEMACSETMKCDGIASNAESDAIAVIGALNQR